MRLKVLNVLVSLGVKALREPQLHAADELGCELRILLAVGLEKILPVSVGLLALLDCAPLLIVLLRNHERRIFPAELLPGLDDALVAER